MKRLYAISRLFLVVWVIGVSDARAQLDQEFWFAAPEVTQQHEDRPVRFRISTADTAATIRISFPANNALPDRVFTLAANSTRTENLTSIINSIENTAYNVVANKGIRITATASITVYYEVGQRFNVDLFALKGQNALGKSFILPGQNRWQNNTSISAYSTADLVATENNTVVTVVPSVAVEGHSAGDTFNILMDRGETFSIRNLSQAGSATLAGTFVSSTKPLAITIKDDSIEEGFCYDLAGDQIVPIGILGTEYVMIRGQLNGTERAFFTATQDGTELFSNGSATPFAQLNRGQTASLTISGRVYVEATKPIYAMQYTGIGCEIGGALIPPVNCRGTKQLGFTRATNEDFYLNILVRDEGKDDFRLNGSTTAIQASQFGTVPGTGGEWAMAQIAFTTGVIAPNQGHLIVNDSNSFQVGILEGDEATGSRYGYFSNFSSLFIGDDFALCEGDTQQIAAIGDPGSTYRWSTGSTASSIMVSDTGTYWLEMTNPAGCILRDTIRVTLSPLITGILGPDRRACQGEAVRIDPGSNYLVDRWSTGFTGDVLTVREAGVYTVDMYNLAGCPATDTIEVMFQQPHQVSITPDTVFCEGEQITLQPTTSAASPSYLWSNRAETASITTGTAGLYWVEVTDRLCTVRDSVEVSAQPKPKAFPISGPEVVCPGVRGVVYSVEDQASVAYQWSIKGGDLIFGQGTSQASVNWGAANDTALITLMHTNFFQCTNDTTLAIRINTQLAPSLPQGDTRVCTNLRRGNEYSVSPTPGSVYRWRVAGGTITGGQGSETVRIDWAEVGSWQLSVLEESLTPLAFCSGESDTLSVELFRDTTRLQMRNVSLLEADEQMVEMFWSANDPAGIVGNISTQRRALNTSEWLTLDSTLLPDRTTYQDGSANTQTTSYEYRSVAFSQCDEFLSSGFHRTILLSGSQSAATDEISLSWTDYINWEGGVSEYQIWRRLDGATAYTLVDQLTSSLITNYRANIGADGFVHQYRIKAIGQQPEQVAWSNSITLEFEHPIFIPNVFTPNGDGINDTFDIPKIGLYPNTELNVYNRWGKLVFSQEGYQGGWDGDGLSPGTYFFQLTVDGESFKGPITILKQ